MDGVSQFFFCVCFCFVFWQYWGLKSVLCTQQDRHSTICAMPPVLFLFFDTGLAT
jgi:hypothetical protein